LQTIVSVCAPLDRKTYLQIIYDIILLTRQPFLRPHFPHPRRNMVCKVSMARAPEFELPIFVCAHHQTHTPSTHTNGKGKCASSREAFRSANARFRVPYLLPLLMRFFWRGRCNLRREQEQESSSLPNCRKVRLETDLALSTRAMLPLSGRQF
jgi:hypothetical protein